MCNTVKLAICYMLYITSDSYTICPFNIFPFFTTRQDFLQIQPGNLAHFLKRVIVFAAKHVQQCALCSQKGFICEICDSEKVIYPFDVELTVRVSVLTL